MSSPKFVPPHRSDLKTILRLEQVSLQGTIGNNLLLQDISFEIQTGEIVVIVGTSGAGKTSLLRLLNGLVSPSQGKIYFQEIPWEKYNPIAWRRRLVLAPQEPKLLGMKVIETLAYPLKLEQLSKSAIDARVNNLLELLRIPHEWLSKTELQLSLGQRQLVAIARALIMKPQVILLDEPTSALDLGTATHLLSVLKNLSQAEKLTIVMVSHQLELIADFGDRLLLLNQGSLLENISATSANLQKVSGKILQLQTQEQEEWQ